MGRKQLRCVRCRSKPRTRTIFALLDALGALKGARTALHLAPETALVPRLREHLGSGYTLADIREEALSRHEGIDRLILDATCLSDEAKARRFDLVIHSHVLEHLRASWTVAFLRLHALINPGGWHVFAVPIRREWSSEDLSDIGDEERRRRFGQHDHVRWIGRRDFDIDMAAMADLTGAALFEPAEALLPPEVMRRIGGGPNVYVMQKAS